MSRFDYEDRISSELIATSEHEARVPHDCAACGETIRPGQRYVREFGMVDGTPMVQTRHALACVEPW